MACVNNVAAEFGFAHTRCNDKIVNTYGTSFMSVVYVIYMFQIVKHCLQYGILITMRSILQLPNTTHRPF